MPSSLPSASKRRPASNSSRVSAHALQPQAREELRTLSPLADDILLLRWERLSGPSQGHIYGTHSVQPRNGQRRNGR